MPRRPTLAIFAMVLVVVGQLGAFAHQAGTRHVTCSEHGEQLEAAALLGATHVQGGDHAHWHGNEGTSGGHSHCAILRALHQASTPGIAADVAVAHVATDVLEQAPLVAVTRDELPRYLIAPKTSPPSGLRTS